MEQEVTNLKANELCECGEAAVLMDEGEKYCAECYIKILTEES